MTAQMKVLGLWILWAIGNSETLPAKWRREVIHKIVKQNKQNWSPSNTRKSSRTRKEIERSGWSQRHLLSAKRTTHWKRLDSRWPGAFCTDPPLVGKWKTTTKMRKCGKQKWKKKQEKRKGRNIGGSGEGTGDAQLDAFRGVLRRVIARRAPVESGVFQQHAADGQQSIRQDERLTARSFHLQRFLLADRHSPRLPWRV